MIRIEPNAVYSFDELEAMWASQKVERLEKAPSFESLRRKLGPLPQCGLGLVLGAHVLAALRRLQADPEPRIVEPPCNRVGQIIVGRKRGRPAGSTGKGVRA